MIKNKWIIFYAIVVSAAAVFAYFSYLKYSELENSVRIENERHVNNLTKVVNSFFIQYEAMLQLVGNELIEDELYKDRVKSAKLLDKFRESTPLIIGLGFIDPKGNMLATNSNISFQKVNNILKTDTVKKSFFETLQSKYMVIGRVYFFKPLQNWIIPVRKAIYDTDGKVIGVIAAGLVNALNNNIFNDFHFGNGKNIVLAKSFQSGFYRIFHTNHDINIDIGDLYTKPISTELYRSINEQIYKECHMTLEDLKTNNKICSFEIFNAQNKSVIGSIGYDKRYKLWVIVYSDNYLFLNDFFKHLGVIVTIYFLLMGMFYLLFKMIAKYEQEKESDLIYRTTHDSLTKLPNRTFIYENICYSKKYKLQENSEILFLDIDNFKNINDKFGHALGDKILIIVAQRLQSFFSPNDIVARQGGDEFIIINNTTQKSLDELIDVISMPYIVDKLEFRLGVSIGVAKHPDDGDTFDTLLSLADMAMYEAKKVKNSYCYFSAQMREKNIENSEIESELRSALDKNELFMLYQPQINQDGTIHGVEALLRWNNKKLGQVPPHKFIPIAEASGQILKIGDFILRRSLNDIKAVYKQLGKTFQLSINISIIQLMDHKFFDTLLAILKEEKFDNNLLTLEITESLPIDDIDYVLPILKEIRSENIHLSLDDFGTGYSSLSILEKLPIVELKIDKAFVDEILYSNEDKNLVKTIIDIGKNFSMHILAEGVELEGQVDLLRKYGCDTFQGYYFSKPLEKELLVKFIKECKC
ncbi:bifunctional diguanylate cyclase/phosphodiesterase [Sulfurimonas sp.]